MISKKELPYTDVDGDYIYIHQKISKGLKNLKQPYSSENAKEMTKEEMLDLVAETNESLKKSLIDKAIY